MTSDLYKKVEDVIQKHIHEHQQEVVLGKALLQKLDIHRVNNPPISQDYSFNLKKELEGKSEHYFDYDRNDLNRKNPFPKELNIQLEQIRQQGGFEWTPGT